MKSVLCVLIFLLIDISPVLAQPATRQDIESLKKDVESLKKDIESLKTYVDLKIEALSNELKGELKAVNTTIVEMDKRLSGQITLLMWMMGILAGFMGLLIALPQVLDFLRGRKEIQARLEKMEMEISELKERLFLRDSQ
ncbi:hypothetical protein HYR99_40675 [Candidatus Poribacteria bacterium]|nr:hypothetical protein [Candidatus Poribacteria bacterium]